MQKTEKCVKSSTAEVSPSMVFNILVETEIVCP